MSQLRRLVVLPMALAAVAALLVWSTAAFAGGALGAGGVILLVLAGGMCAASVVFFRMRLSQNQIELEQQAAQIAEEKAAVEALKASLEKDSVSFENRRQSFEKRLMTYHEWSEFPSVNEIAESEALAEDVAEQDRKVAELTQEAAVKVFERLSQDRYAPEGNFDPRLLVNDMVEFVGDIARVYQPDAKQPILETSVEKLLKSLNHITLQLLFQVEQLPLNLKEYSLAKAYDHVKTGTKVYGYYKSISPYLPYANYTWQVGRLVLGANPILAGTWILGGEVVKRTGKKLSKHYIDRYSLKLMSEAVRIVANEAAITFDPHYRYRDPNWVYGVELAELVHIFPLSRETLQQALQEVGNLPLRNSYDRIFLYRCIASGLSPKPDVMSRQASLSAEQRRQIAERLESFFRHHVHGRRKERVAAWSAAAGERLGISFQVTQSQPQAVSESDHSSALYSLGAFLFAVQEADPESVPDKLRRCEIANQLEATVRDEVIAGLVEQPPMFFDYPDLDSESPLVAVYLRDLISLERRTIPKDLQGYWAIREVCEFLRQDPKDYEGELVEGYARAMSGMLDADSPESIQDPGLVLALVRFLEPEGESPCFVYPKAAPEEGGDGGSKTPDGKNIKPVRWLVGTTQRLMLVEVRDGLQLDDFKRQQIVWSLPKDDSKTGSVSISRSKGLMADALVLRGGQWANGALSSDTVVNPGVKIPGERTRKYGPYFQPLHKWLAEIGVLEVE